MAAANTESGGSAANRDANGVEYDAYDMAFQKLERRTGDYHAGASRREWQLIDPTG